MRLIDVDTCLSQLKPCLPEDKNWQVTGETALRLIHTAVDNTPTTDPLDALGICRCKDCIHLKYIKYYQEKELCCKHRHGLPDPKETDYCPYAKKKG